MDEAKNIEKELVEARQQIEYYKQIAKLVGDIRLREIEEMSQLIQKLRHTERELQESIETLQNAQKRLVESEKNAALTTLVAGVAHEINTPVGICITAASHLHDVIGKIVKRLSPELLHINDINKIVTTTTEATDVICTNLSRAAELIRSFKMVAVDQSREEQREFNLKDYLDNVIKSLTPELNKAKHTILLSCPENIVLTSYPGTFSQIITNLVMNSLIHGFETTQNGSIEIAVSAQNRQLNIDYHDNGRGMNQEQLKKVFTPFFTTKRGQGGTGLGMHIIYNLVTQKLGGKINCESAPGNGVTISITTPLTIQ